MAEGQRIGCLDAWPCICKQIRLCGPLYHSGLWYFNIRAFGSLTILSNQAYITAFLAKSKIQDLVSYKYLFFLFHDLLHLEVLVL